jgi:hypothetical protein
MADGAQPPAPAGNSRDTYAHAAVVIAVVAGLIGLGVLPASCGKMLPVVGRHYRQYCDDCGGNGTVSRSCPSCSGRGYYAGATCTACGGSGWTAHTCAFCGGSGKKPTK